MGLTERDKEVFTPALPALLYILTDVKILAMTYDENKINGTRVSHCFH